MPTKTVSMQALKRGQRLKRTVDLGEGATVKDVIGKLAELTGIAKSDLFVAEVRNMDKVRLFGGEAPTGAIEVGGLEGIEDLPEVISVERHVESMSLETSLALLEELISAYQAASFQGSLSKFKQSFLDGEHDFRQYNVLLADVAAEAQETILPKYGFENTTSGRVEMYAAMKDVDSNEQVKTKQVEIMKLLGQHFEWVPEAKRPSLA
mmetsp:Transcript_51933/g.97145  ORF Transcript_51933/g.97145 Transcript_51933/m.97145 type:complete len:208 (+) Transcript_51933:65-688(+)